MDKPACTWKDVQPVTVASTQETRNSKCWRGCEEKGKPYTLLLKYRLWKAVRRFLKTLEMITYNLIMLLLIRWQKYSVMNSRYLDVHGSIIYNAYLHDLEITSVPTDRCLDKESLVQKNTNLGGFCFCFKCILPFATTEWSLRILDLVE